MGTEKRARQKEMHRTRAEEARKAAHAQARRRQLVNLSLLAAVAAVIIGAVVLWSSNSDSSSDSTTTTAAKAASDSKSTTTTAGGSTSVAGGSTTTVAKAVKTGTAECPAADGSSKRQTEFDGAPKMCIDAAKTYVAKVETTMGTFTIALDPKIAPNTVNNFVFLSRYHYYDGIIFHRIIKDFMIQGGDPQGTGTGGPGYEFNDELPKQGDYKKYSVAMANAGPNTNGSQFFIITGDQGVALPPSYSLFGQVTAGTDIIDKLGVVPTETGDRPTTEVKMKKVTITES